jgi:predicted P-loop ATPase
MNDWISRAKQNSSFESVASNLGMSCKGKRWTPCPACGEEQVGTKDKRGPIGIVRSTNSTGWTCFRCQAGGDMMDLVAYSLEGMKCRDVSDYSNIKEFFKTKEFTSFEVPSFQKQEVPAQDLKALWQQIKKQPIQDDGTPDKIDTFLRRRGINPLNVAEAYVMPIGFHYNNLTKVETSSGRMMPFWPWKWAQEYPLCVPLVDSKGNLKSFQGRAVEKIKDRPKTMCPIGYSMSGLFFACEQMRKFLRNESSFTKFWIVEGEMDFISLKARGATNPVMGIKNGSLSAFQQFKFPAVSEIIIATHNDQKGDEYAEKIAKAIYPIQPKRLILEEGDVNDYFLDKEKDVLNLYEEVNQFPGYKNIVGDKALQLLKNTFEQLEDAKRADRINTIVNLFDHTEDLAVAFRYAEMEAEKYFYRIQALHGCAKVARKLRAAIDVRLRGSEMLSTEAGPMIQTEGADPDVELFRKAIMEKGVKIGEGEIKSVILNLHNILQDDKRLQDKFQYNEFSGTVEVKGEPLDDNITMETLLFVQRNYEQLEFPLSTVGKSINYAASKNRYHPVRDILEDWRHNLDMSKAPDHARPENLYTYYYRSEITTGPKQEEYNELIQLYGRMFCKGFCMRQIDPGCEWQLLPILIGPQGCGKSISTEILAIEKDFFSRGDLDLKSKDSKLVLAGCALYEFDECNTLLEHGYEAIKGFISNPRFKLRKPYEAHVSTINASWVLVGNSNIDQLGFLSDPTGSRRFMAFRVGIGGMVRIDELREDLPYIYARAMHCYYGEKEYADRGPDTQNWFPKHIEERQQNYNRQFSSQDPWLPYIHAHCKMKWNDYNNKKGLRDISARDLKKTRYIYIREILQDVLEIPAKQQDRKAAKRAGEILSSIGIKPMGQTRYGNQKITTWLIPEDLYKYGDDDPLTEGDK